MDDKQHNCTSVNNSDGQRHKHRQQRLKVKIDTKIADAQIEKGVLLVLTGNGKGKTTGGFGSILRAIGHGKKAAVVQFIKGDWPSGERLFLEKSGVEFHVMASDYTWESQDKQRDTMVAVKVWEAAETLLKDESVDIILLDELTYMLSYHYLDLERVLEALAHRPAKQHVIITGRGCHRAILALADTVTELRSEKHAFDNGVKAQLGFDY